MKIAALTTIFNEPSYVFPQVVQFEDFDIPHLFMVGMKPWHGEIKPDGTWSALAELALADERIMVLNKRWDHLHEEFNEGLSLLRQMEFDWAIIVDADEFYCRGSIEQIIYDINLTDKEALTAPLMHVYWATPSYRVVPEQPDNPIIAIRTDQTFNNIRSSLCEKEVSLAELHHLSYVRTDEEMWKKICSFEHADEFDKEKWYNEVWLKWTPAMKNLHPTVPSQFEKAIWHPVPKEIRDRLTW